MKPVINRLAMVGLIWIGIAATGCQNKKAELKPESRRDNSGAVAMLQTINHNAQTCWMKSKDKDFRNYRVIPELDTRTGKPRILIVKAKAAQGLPQYVIEGVGTPARISTYGPLGSDALGTRMNQDISRWQAGGKGCSAQG